MVWQVRFASYGNNIYEELLQDGWKPFAVTAVTGEGYNSKIWFRKLTRYSVEKPEKVVSQRRVKTMTNLRYEGVPLDQLSKKELILALENLYGLYVSQTNLQGELNSC